MSADPKKHRRIYSSSDWDYNRISQIIDKSRKIRFCLKSSSFVGLVNQTSKNLNKKQSHFKDIFPETYSTLNETKETILQKNSACKIPYNKQSLTFSKNNSMQNANKVIEKSNIFLRDGKNFTKSSGKKRNSLASIFLTNSKDYQKQDKNPYCQHQSKLSNIYNSSTFCSQCSHWKSKPANLSNSLLLKNDVEKSSHFFIDLGCRHQNSTKTLQKNFSSTKHCTNNKLPNNHIRTIFCDLFSDNKKSHDQFHSQLDEIKLDQSQIMENNINKSYDLNNNSKRDLSMKIHQLQQNISSLMSVTSKIEFDNLTLQNKIKEIEKHQHILQTEIEKNDTKLKALTISNIRIESFIKFAKDNYKFNDGVIAGAEIQNLQTDCSAQFEFNDASKHQYHKPALLQANLFQGNMNGKKCTKNETETIQIFPIRKITREKAAPASSFNKTLKKQELTHLMKKRKEQQQQLTSKIFTKIFLPSSYSPQET